MIYVKTNFTWQEVSTWYVSYALTKTLLWKKSEWICMKDFICDFFCHNTSYFMTVSHKV